MQMMMFGFARPLQKSWRFSSEGHVTLYKAWLRNPPPTRLKRTTRRWRFWRSWTLFPQITVRKSGGQWVASLDNTMSYIGIFSTFFSNVLAVYVCSAITEETANGLEGLFQRPPRLEGTKSIESFPRIFSLLAKDNDDRRGRWADSTIVSEN